MISGLGIMLMAFYYKPKFRTTITLDPETGEHIPNKVFDGMTEEYYIELTEKNRKTGH
jgi:hypothetical protein